MDTLTFYTDGSSLGNPGPGAWAWAMISNNEVVMQNVGGALDVTNNRMEAYAFVDVIKYVTDNNYHNNYNIKIVSDSKICVDTLNSWLWGWGRKGIIQSKKNPDLWQWVYDVVVSTGIEIKAEWVKAHNGDRFNEVVDKLAQEEAVRQRKMI